MREISGIKLDEKFQPNQILRKLLDEQKNSIRTELKDFASNLQPAKYVFKILAMFLNLEIIFQYLQILGHVSILANLKYNEKNHYLMKPKKNTIVSQI